MDVLKDYLRTLVSNSNVKDVRGKRISDIRDRSKKMGSFIPICNLTPDEISMMGSTVIRKIPIDDNVLYGDFMRPYLIYMDTPSKFRRQFVRMIPVDALIPVVLYDDDLIINEEHFGIEIIPSSERHARYGQRDSDFIVRVSATRFGEVTSDSIHTGVHRLYVYYSPYVGKKVYAYTVNVNNGREYVGTTFIVYSYGTLRIDDPIPSIFWDFSVMDDLVLKRRITPHEYELLGTVTKNFVFRGEYEPERITDNLLYYTDITAKYLSERGMMSIEGFMAHMSLNHELTFGVDVDNKLKDLVY